MTLWLISSAAFSTTTQAIKSVHAILRPLEILTRSWPKRPTAAAPSAPGAAPGEGAAAGGAGGAAAEGGTSGQAAGGDGAVAGRAGGVPAVTPASVAPEAGRQVGGLGAADVCWCMPDMSSQTHTSCDKLRPTFGFFGPLPHRPCVPPRLR